MDNDDEVESRVRPMVSAPTSKVTIAFPFSQISTQEPSDELRELARIVVELADHVAMLKPSPEVDRFTDQSRALLARLDR